MTSMLIVDDDVPFCTLLGEHMRARGHDIRLAHDVVAATRIAEDFMPEWVLVDLKMPGVSGLALIPKLLEIDHGTRIVVLTGYATIATAVEAIKLGAAHYLSKPVGTEAIIAAFQKREGDPTMPVDAEPLTLNAAERDHILATYARNVKNISATARELGLHRRTLQRKLDKLL